MKRGTCLTIVCWALLTAWWPCSVTATPVRRGLGVALDGLHRDARYLVYRPTPGVLAVHDSQTGLTRQFAIPSTCEVASVGFARVYMVCPDGAGASQPRLVSVYNGLEEPIQGLQQGDSLITFGQYWFLASQFDGRSSVRLFINWRTGERRGGVSGPPVTMYRADINSPTLVPPPTSRIRAGTPALARTSYTRPGIGSFNDLVLLSHGRRIILSGCVHGCLDVQFDLGLVTWQEGHLALGYRLFPATRLRWYIGGDPRLLFVQHLAYEVVFTQFSSLYSPAATLSVARWRTS